MNALVRYYTRVIKRARKRKADRVVRRYRRKRNILKRKLLHKRKVARASSTDVIYYDGVKVAAWMVPYLDYARQHGWRGHLVSGWRDPVYSQKLCYAMCGSPSCPGRCAGLASNHVGSTKPKGAIDVSDYQTFGRLMKSCPLQPRIFNALGARDPVHYSASGR